MDYSVVLFDLKTEGAPSEKPLMLQPVLFCPVLTWVCQELRACGAQRFFAVCDAFLKKMTKICKKRPCAFSAAVL